MFGKACLRDWFSYKTSFKDSTESTGVVSLNIKLLLGHRTEFHFMYYLKGSSYPNIMMLLPQLLDSCRRSYRGLKFHKNGMNKVRVSVVFSCHKMKDNNI